MTEHSEREAALILLSVIERDLLWADSQPYLRLIYEKMQSAYRHLGLDVPAGWSDGHLALGLRLQDDPAGVERQLLELLGRPEMRDE